MTTSTATTAPVTHVATSPDPRHPAQSRPSFSVVLETENVGSAGLDYLRRSLASLEAQTLSPGSALETIMPQSGDIPDVVLDELAALYPWVSVLPIPAELDYYQAKMAAVRRARGEVVVFADSDCAYEPDWLERLLEPFRRPEVHAVAGSTGMIVSSAYEMGMSAVYFLHPLLRRRPDAPIRHGDRYFANNAAFRRDLLERIPIPEGNRFLRGQCAAHAALLSAESVVIWQQPLARAVHPPLRGTRRFVWRFLLLGEEEVLRARATRRGVGLVFTVARRLARRSLEAPWRLFQLLRDQPKQAWRLPAGATVAAAALALAHVGAGVELVAPGSRLSRALRGRR